MNPIPPTINRQHLRATFLVLLGVLLALGLSGCGTVKQLVAGPTLTPSAPGATPVSPPKALEDFTLINQFGEPVSRDDLTGKPALFYFGYTHCPDVCPLTLAEMSQAAQALGEQASEINWVFVSVDIKRDTPDRLAEYLSLFNTGFIGLTAEDESDLQQATNAFEVFYELEDVADTAAEYLVAHTASTFLVDQEGRLRTIFAYRTEPAVLAREIRTLLETAVSN